ncbi:MAG: metal ABC transporter solute-binding protein, Zn/Mn family, partial [Phycisphaerae bacterium]
MTGTSSSVVKKKVAVTIPPQAWLVKQVGGENVDVTCLVGPQDDPHSYQPTDAMVAELAKCQTYFRIGVPAEEGRWYHALTAMSDMSFVDLRDGIEMRTMAHACSHDHGHHGHGHGHHHHHSADPHTWLSPANLQLQARKIAQSL